MRGLRSVVRECERERQSAWEDQLDALYDWEKWEVNICVQWDNGERVGKTDERKVTKHRERLCKERLQGVNDG